MTDKANLEDLIFGYTEMLLTVGITANQAEYDERVFSKRDITPDTMAEIVADCTDFFNSNKELLEKTNQLNFHMHGHDFYYTRNRHGTGFWDQGYNADVAKKLTANAHAYGSFNLWIADDDSLHGMNG